MNKEYWYNAKGFNVEPKYSTLEQKLKTSLEIQSMINCLFFSIVNSGHQVDSYLRTSRINSISEICSVALSSFCQMHAN